MPYHEMLGVSDDAFRELRPWFVASEYDDREYEFLPDARRGIPRGTVLIDDTVVRGFPKVPRTLVLETGIPAYFDEPIVVEEKLNGYNVRIAAVDGEPLAFTRSGRICPFTTAKVRSWFDLESFFAASPDLAICGELIGRDNPYTPHNYAEVDSLGFRVFDLRDRESGDPLSVRERVRRCRDAGLPQVERFCVVAPADASAVVNRVIDHLDGEGREGVVMKSLDGRRQLKYTTAAANRGDLAYAFGLPFDYGQAFMFRRLLREGFQAVERDAEEQALRERAHRLGESILLPMVNAIRTVQHGDEVGERHTVRGTDDEIDALFAHLERQGLHLVVESDREEGGERAVRFYKRTQSTNDKIRNYLDGDVVKE
ncbi:RNA ligase [Haloferacaceae archaeon DSL9]